MGSLRVVPKQKEPGFISFKLNDDNHRHVDEHALQECIESNLSIKTRQGTEIRVNRQVPLKQVARLVRMLEGRG